MFASDAEPQQPRLQVGLAGNGGSALDGRLDPPRLVAWRMIRTDRQTASARSAPPSTSKDTTAPKPAMKLRAVG